MSTPSALATLVGAAVDRYGLRPTLFAAVLVGATYLLVTALFDSEDADAELGATELDRATELVVVQEDA